MPDSWKSEIQTFLERSNMYLTLKSRMLADSTVVQVVALIDDVALYAYERLKLVIKKYG